MESLNRRQFIRFFAVGSAGALLAACQQQATPAATKAAATAAAATKPAATAAAATAAATAASGPGSGTGTGGGQGGGFKPSRPITLICPWAAGGGTDAVARIVGALLEKEVGQPVNVVNRTGGSDGHTITIITIELVLMHWQKITEITYKDFVAIAQVNLDPAAVMVAETAEWKDIKSFLEYVKANPGKVKASGTGKGGIWDLSRAGMLKAAGIPVDAIPWVPSEGAAPGLQELVAGGVQLVPASLPEGRSLIDAKKVRPLAVMADERQKAFPDLPTLKESGVNWSMGSWRGFALPKGGKPNQVTFYEAALKKIYESKDFKDFMDGKGYGMIWRGSADYTTFMAQQDESMGVVMKEAGIIS